MGGDSSACPCLPVCLSQTFTVSPSVVVAIPWSLHVSLSLDCRVSVCCVCVFVCVRARARARACVAARACGWAFALLCMGRDGQESNTKLQQLPQ